MYRFESSGRKPPVIALLSLILYVCHPAIASAANRLPVISATPPLAGTSSGIVISDSDSDGEVSTSLPAFSIMVSDANSLPVISGTPVTYASVGQPYSFKPMASDADGDPLTFRITNKPAWASFDTSNGTLYGVPGNTGTHVGILISVSDGKAAASLAPYTVAVSPAQTTSVTLSWDAPRTNTDGTPLVNLTGFRVFYGTASGQYSQSLSIASSSVRSVVLQGLGSGNTWYFTVTAIASGGVESAYANEVSKTLP